MITVVSKNVMIWKYTKFDYVISRKGKAFSVIAFYCLLTDRGK